MQQIQGWTHAATTLLLAMLHVMLHRVSRTWNATCLNIIFHVVEVVSTTSPGTCPPGWIHCTGGNRCAKRCDGRYECIDGADEMGCATTTVPYSPTHQCALNQYTCSDGSCVPKDSVCNGSHECRDFSDEAGCHIEPISPSKCLNSPTSQFLCDSSTICQPNVRCDNKTDCIDNTDERDCDNNLEINLVQTNTDAGTVFVSWSLKQGGVTPKWFSITGNRISYWPKVLHKVKLDQLSSSKYNKTLDIGSSKSHLFNNLDICSEYEIQIRVLGSRFYGPWTEPIKVRTRDAKTSAPQNISTTITNSTLKVTWSPPKTICRNITMYQVTYSTHGLSRSLVSHNCEIEIPKIDLFHSYTIEVVAINNIGDKKSTGMVATASFSSPKADKRTAAREGGISKLAWAIPVGIVGFLLLLLLVYFVRKSHRLQRSMYVLLTRNTDAGGEVTFHSDDDDPLIRGFADDVPLVTA